MKKFTVFFLVLSVFGFPCFNECDLLAEESVIYSNSGSSVKDYKKSWNYNALQFQSVIDLFAPFGKANFVTTHNSFNAGVYSQNGSYIDPNQKISIFDQLEIGVRALELDVHYAFSSSGFWPWDWEFGEELKLSHGDGNTGCHPNDRYFAQGLEEISSWISNNPNEVVLIMLEDHMEGEYEKAMSDLDKTIGHLVYKPNGCQRLPMDLTKADVLAEGKQILVLGGNCSTDNWSDYAFKSSWSATKSINDFIPYPVTTIGGKDAEYLQSHLVRVYEDSTVLSSIFDSPDRRITAKDTAELTEAGIIAGFDQVIPFDTRLTAEIWSWANNQPDNAGGDEDCAAQGADGRFGDSPCSLKKKVACKDVETSEWYITANTYTWAEAASACAIEFPDKDLQFGVPVNGYENAVLRDLKTSLNVDDVWLNYSDQWVEGEWRPYYTANEEFLTTTYYERALPTGGQIAGAPEKDDHVGYSLATGDFNGDGFADVAMGAPYEDINNKDDAGAVDVIYGSAKGLNTEEKLSEVWHQDTDGILGVSEDGDNFGYAVTSADFNNDGFDDLAIGVPNEDLSGGSNAGYVNVIYGSLSGLTSVGDQAWHQDTAGIYQVAEADDRFGFALAAGDFNHDGFADLAIGVPKEDIPSGGNDNDGAVNIIYGSLSGLTTPGDQVWHQNKDGVNGTAETDDHFGYSLAAGDFNHDGFDDLAIGVPKEDISSGGNNNDGYVNVMYGSSTGITATGDHSFYQGKDGLNGGSEKDDHFGYALATGDFDNDGFDDLAVGKPFEDINGDDDAGAVSIIFGTSGGLSATGDQLWHQDTTGIKDSTQGGDRFGYSLAAGDFDGDGDCDLAIGVPKEDVNGDDNAGAVAVMYSTSSGFAGADDFWHQDSTGIVNSTEDDDHFGMSVAAGDFNGDGIIDLCIGAPKEDLGIGGNNNDGAVHVITGKSGTGLDSDHSQMWYQ